MDETLGMSEKELYETACRKHFTNVKHHYHFSDFSHSSRYLMKIAIKMFYKTLPQHEMSYFSKYSICICWYKHPLEKVFFFKKKKKWLFLGESLNFLCDKKLCILFWVYNYCWKKIIKEQKFILTKTAIYNTTY